MDFIIRHLNSNSGLIVAIATIVLVGITWRYVRLTGSLVRLTGSLLKATYRPYISVYQRSERHDKFFYIQSICVKNVGVGVARKIRFRGDLTFQTEKGSPLNEIYFIRKGIDALAPGQELRRAVTPLSDIRREDHNYPSVSITVTYEDLAGEIHNEEFKLDFNDVHLDDQIVYV